MNFYVTIEHFQLNRVLKVLEGTLHWKIRVGYIKSDKKEEALPMLTAEYASGYLIRNININSTSLNIQELANLLNNKRENFKQVDKEDIILLDDILEQDNNLFEAVDKFQIDFQIELTYNEAT